MTAAVPSASLVGPAARVSRHRLAGGSMTATVGTGPGALLAGAAPGDRLEPPPRGPSIVYFKAHHYAVLERVGRRGARVAAPAVGRMWLAPDEFRRRYGALFTLVPGRAFRRRRTPLRQALLL